MQAQADFLDVYRRLTNAANETLKVALRNTEQLSEQQRQWARAAVEQSDLLANRLAEAGSVNDVFVAQSHFAFSLLTQTIEGGWRVFRALQDGQLEAMSRMEAQVAQTNEAARRTYELAVRAMQDASSMAFSTAATESSGAGKRAGSWNGMERRTGAVVPFTGPERRRKAG